jgi:hypothetical protein
LFDPLLAALKWLQRRPTIGEADMVYAASVWNAMLVELERPSYWHMTGSVEVPDWPAVGAVYPAMVSNLGTAFDLDAYLLRLPPYIGTCDVSDGDSPATTSLFMLAALSHRDEALEAVLHKVFAAFDFARHERMRSLQVQLESTFLSALGFTFLEVRLTELLLVAEGFLYKGPSDWAIYPSPTKAEYGWALTIDSSILQYRDVTSISEYVKERLMRNDLGQSKRRRPPKPIPDPPPLDTVASMSPSKEKGYQSTDARLVFLVHGQDIALRETAARWLEHELRPECRLVVLHEQANSGRTLIEKFEDYGRLAAYAIVLLTADDEGRRRGSKGRCLPRARENVVFEMGFFFGALGRDRVAVLYEPEVEVPSDLSGFAYIQADPSGGWKVPLLRDLRDAGLVRPDVNISGAPQRNERWARVLDI